MGKPCNLFICGAERCMAIPTNAVQAVNEWIIMMETVCTFGEMSVWMLESVQQTSNCFTVKNCYTDRRISMRRRKSLKCSRRWCNGDLIQSWLQFPRVTFKRRSECAPPSTSKWFTAWQVAHQRPLAGVRWLVLSWLVHIHFLIPSLRRQPNQADCAQHI